ncbi:YkvA family protein [Herbidospora galbida]|nr:DUF1232 domain-containing protein [Herbidospora galbida]
MDIGLAIVAALALTWLTLIAALAVLRPRGGLLREALRVLPDVLRLIRRLAADRDLPRGVRIRLGLLLVYLAVPIDLIPDFIPVLGYADDAIVVVAVLRSVVRRAGLPAVRAHWPGTDDGFEVVKRLTGMGAARP